MTNIAVLKTEIDTDPLGRGYVGMTDEQVAVDLNTEYRDVSAFVSVDDVRQYLITQIDGTGTSQRSSLDMIREFALNRTVRGVEFTSNAPDARQSAAQMIWYMLGMEDADTTFPVGDTNVRNQFISIGPDGGNGPGVLTGSQLTDIDNMATKTISRGEELGLGVVKVGHVEQARTA